MGKTNKPRFSVDQVIDAAKQTKGLVSLMAKRLGCNPQTVRNYAARYSTVAQAIKEEREAMVDVAELALYNQVTNGESWAVQFTLRTLGKDRGYTDRHEVTGEGGRAIVVTLKLGDDESDEG